ncbi:hypothetical protein CEXT_112891 [Caerostris extrusa]|uniref:Uncharacterized protein n=1 Tax=Caerostris extrusa TaxID=172846 RepID=A0AAV4Q7X8_CAEEX|nr:hypothetical protein CEXT_112891 [Caerostris extrusa]
MKSRPPLDNTRTEVQLDLSGRSIRSWGFDFTRIFALLFILTGAAPVAMLPEKLRGFPIKGGSGISGKEEYRRIPGNSGEGGRKSALERRGGRSTENVAYLCDLEVCSPSMPDRDLLANSFRPQENVSTHKWMQ